MANDTIKKFVESQTAGIKIGIPQSRPRPDENVRNAVVEKKFPKQTEEVKAQRGQVGRPRGSVEKVKISVYVPAEVKDRLIRIQHNNYKQSLNDVLVEAVNCLLEKYNEK